MTLPDLVNMLELAPILEEVPAYLGSFSEKTLSTAPAQPQGRWVEINLDTQSAVPWWGVLFPGAFPHLHNFFFNFLLEPAFR